MRYLSLGEVLELHRRVVQQSGGAEGIRDLGLLESALAQPRMAFGGHELYPTLVEKASALCFSLVSNHPFLDGNKRIGHASLEVFLMLNGQQLSADLDDSEQLMLRLAASTLSREGLVAWIRLYVVPYDGS